MKYKLTENSIESVLLSFDKRTLFQIQALKDFGNIKAGDLGGYIEKESNLSQEGDCWIYGNAIVYDNARVFDNAKVCDDAQVYGNAIVYDEAIVGGNVEVSGNARVGGDVKIGGNINVQIGGEAVLIKLTEVSSNVVNKPKTNQEEKQQPPKHYDLTIQPIDYIIANKLDFAEGNIIKYVSRYKQKNGKEDLLKARYYLDLLIKEIGE